MASAGSSSKRAHAAAPGAPRAPAGQRERLSHVDAKNAGEGVRAALDLAPQHGSHARLRHVATVRAAKRDSGAAARSRGAIPSQFAPATLNAAFARRHPDQLKQIGIDGELEPVETANWFPKLARKDYHIGLNNTGSGVDDQFFENYACGSERN
jgi:hypothetical protein